MMKTGPVWASVLLAAALAPVQALAAEVATDLAARLADAPDDALIPVYVVMDDALDRDALDRELPAKLYTKEQRRRAFVSRAKATAERSQAQVLATLRSQPATEVSRIRPLWILNAVAFDADRGTIEQVAALPGVARVELNERSFALPVEKEEVQAARGPAAGANIAWGVDKVRAPEVWAEGVTGRGVVVAELDTGVCYSHPDLATRIWANPGEIAGNGIDDDGNGYVDDDKGWDFASNDKNPADDYGHGTHVAGSVVGNGVGGTITGVAPGAKIMIGKVLDFGYGDGTAVWEAYQYAVENGADLVTASVGWVTGWHSKNRADWREATNNAAYAGMILVFAAGNERDWVLQPESIRSPGDVPVVITVGATDRNDRIGYFSSNGPTEWGTNWRGEDTDGPYNDWEYNDGGLTKPDVSAPGVGINSTLDCSGYSGDSWDGTSMATPHVAGVIALMLQANPDLTRDDIVRIFSETSIDLGTPGKDNDYGVGRVDAYRAVGAATVPSDIAVSVVAQNTLVTAGERVRLTVTFKNTTDVDQTFQAWLEGSRPDGRILREAYYGPEDFTVPAGESVSFNANLPTAGGKPGTYLATIKVGTFGTELIDSEHVEFTVR